MKNVREAVDNRPPSASFEPVAGNVFHEATRDVTFKPGNLVHGVKALTKESWKELLTKGIMAPVHRKYESFSANQICFSMLSDSRLPDRYYLGGHEAPKSPIKIHSPHEINIGIIVSGEQVIKDFPDQTFAVGYLFSSALNRRSRGIEATTKIDPADVNMLQRLPFTVDLEKKTVRGIPITGVPSDLRELDKSKKPWWDVREEVRYPKWDDEVKIVFPDEYASDATLAKYKTEGSVMPFRGWLGITVPDQQSLDMLLQWTQELGITTPAIPIYNYDLDKVNNDFIRTGGK